MKQPNIMHEAITRYLSSPDHESFTPKNMAEKLVVRMLIDNPPSSADFFLKMIDACQTY